MVLRLQRQLRVWPAPLVGQIDGCIIERGARTGAEPLPKHGQAFFWWAKEWLSISLIITHYLSLIVDDHKPVSTMINPITRLVFGTFSYLVEDQPELELAD